MTTPDFATFEPITKTYKRTNYSRPHITSITFRPAISTKNQQANEGSGPSQGAIPKKTRVPAHLEVVIHPRCKWYTEEHFPIPDSFGEKIAAVFQDYDPVFDEEDREFNEACDTLQREFKRGMKSCLMATAPAPEISKQYPWPTRKYVNSVTAFMDTGSVATTKQAILQRPIPYLDWTQNERDRGPKNLLRKAGFVSPRNTSRGSPFTPTLSDWSVSIGYSETRPPTEKIRLSDINPTITLEGEDSGQK